MNKKTLRGIFSLLIITVFLPCGHVFSQIDTSIFRGLKARSIGPAGMSGRISEVIAVESNPAIMYVGSATGGVWKSTSGGITWKPLFDAQPVASIGAVAVLQSNPSIVWVGTGEGNPRNSSSVGNGVYKSMDGGETWTHHGLEKTEKIHRVVLDPMNQNVAYVAALGPTWSESTERGVFKTTDGGKTWNKILFVNEKTGCADLAMDPSNPNKLFAAMWEHRRFPWIFNSGGAGSGLYVTYDGGAHWTKCVDDNGLPKGEYGRIGIAIAHSNPDVVYALIEAKKNALSRSADGGKTWRIINATSDVAPRPFYFADIRVDPKNENRIYSLHYNVTVSEDGGKTFSPTSWGIHSDHHALWIHPQNPNLLIDGNDGGVAISYDRGRTWRFVDNLPLAQFYHINIDMQLPFHVYGGMQDNGSWRGPSDVWEWGGIRNFHWENVGGGDGFAVLSDPTDANVGYSMSQGGYLSRFNIKTGERKNIRPAEPDGIRLRFNWNAAIAIDPFEPAIVYYGSQFVHKSSNKGDSWTIISPDLTTNDTTKQKQSQSGGLTPDVTAAENHTTILTIAPSAVQKGIIWVGTDDGNVQVTQDGGSTWTNVAKNIPDLPPTTWCPHVEASKYEAGAAYAVFDDHRRGNWKTYVYKTENFGKTWTSLTKNDPLAGKKNEMWGYALVIEQDPVKKDLLYLGTEFGLFISFDDGKTWMKWTHGFPTVSTMALIVHPREHDLVIGTHGRAAYILDDVRPLRALTKEVLEKPLHIFQTPNAYQHTSKSSPGYGGIGNAMFSGATKPYGVTITFYVNPLKDTAKVKEVIDEKKEPEETQPVRGRMQRAGNRDSRKNVKIEIYDEAGNMIRRTETAYEKGLNRWTWGFRRDGYKSPRWDRPAEDTIRPEGVQVLPGRYTIKIKLGKDTAMQIFDVLPDQRKEFSVDARKKKLAMVMYVGERLELFAEAIDRISKVRKSIDIALDQLKDSTSEAMKVFKKECDSLKSSLKKVGEKILAPTDIKGIQRDDDRVTEKYRYVSGSLGSSTDEPTQTERTYLRFADELAVKVLSELNGIFQNDVKRLAARLDEMHLRLIPMFEELKMK